MKQKLLYLFPSLLHLSCRKKSLSWLKSTKPVVVNFIGGDRAQIEKASAFSCFTLEDAAHKAVFISKEKTLVDFIGFHNQKIAKIVKTEVSGINQTISQTND